MMQSNNLHDLFTFFSRFTFLFFPQLYVVNFVQKWVVTCSKLGILSSLRNRIRSLPQLSSKEEAIAKISTAFIHHYHHHYIRLLLFLKRSLNIMSQEKWICRDFKKKIISWFSFITIHDLQELTSPHR